LKEMASDSVRLRDLAAFVDRKIKSLINNDLKEICRQEGLPVSGVKAALQKRISEGNPIPRVHPPLSHTPLTTRHSVIAHHLRKGDAAALERLRYRAEHSGRDPPAQSHQPSLARDTITPISPAPSTTAGMPAYPRPSNALPTYHQTPAARSVSTPRASVRFRESPFYQIKEALTATRELSGTYPIPCRLVLATMRD
jgi:E3 SUMO-protein ligase PIAS1